MIAFVLASGNAPFTIALGVMAGIAILELFSLLVGTALSGLLDSVLPDFDADLHFDVDGDGIPDVPFLHGIAHWFHLGQAPALALLVIFLTGFGLAGWITQSFFVQFTGNFGNPWVAGLPALGLGFASMRLFGGLLARVGIRDETTAQSADSLIGNTAVITLGTATKTQPSQAKFRDKHGQTHYVIVEPLRSFEEFAPGESVTLVQREGAKYLVIGSSVDALLSLGIDDLPVDATQKAN